MKFDGPDRRKIKRFKISGCTVSYRLKKAPFSWFQPKEKSCPVEEISRGGVRFVSRKTLRQDRSITLKLRIPDDKETQTFKGRIKWIRNSMEGKLHQIGVQFNPYGLRGDENHPRCLKQLIRLEEIYTENRDD